MLKKAVRGETSATGTLIFAILLVVALGVVWVYTGGPSRSDSHSGPFFAFNWPTGTTTPDGGLFPVQSFNQTMGARGSDSGETPPPEPPPVDSKFGLGSITIDSPYASAVSLDASSAGSNDPKQEYLILTTRSGTGKNATISGWSLMNSAGTKVKIGQAAALPFLGTVNGEGPVTVGPDTRIYLITGRSPNGVSFRLNKCTGYFSQNQRFTPSLPSECPTPGQEFDTLSNLTQTNDACYSFVQNIGRCRFVGAAPQTDIGSACQNLVMNTLSYNGCINAHKNDPGFYKNEWRIYLGRDQELWKNTHEEIRLLDENGKTVSVVGY